MNFVIFIVAVVLCTNAFSVADDQNNAGGDEIVDEEIINDSHNNFDESIVMQYTIDLFRQRLQGLLQTLPKNLSSDNLSITMWVITDNRDRVLISLGRLPEQAMNLNRGSEFRFFINDEGMVVFEDNDGFGNFGFSTEEDQHSNMIIADNQWHHIAFVKENNIGKYYIDGILTSTVTSDMNIKYRNFVFCFAAECRYPTDESLFFTGMFDKFILYNKALTYDEVMDIYEKSTEEITPIHNDHKYLKFIKQFRKRLSKKILNKPVLQYVLDKYSFQSTDFILEFGVWMASSINMIGGRNSHIPKIFGFDSFEGLPEDWSYPWVKGSFNMHGNMPQVRYNIELIKGWFNESIPYFKNKYMEPENPTVESVTDINGNFESISNKIPFNKQIALLHVDCDLYSSTKTIFEYFKANILPGTIIVFDELLNFKGYEKHELKALYEFITETGKTFDIIGAECAGTCQPAAIIIT